MMARRRCLPRQRGFTLLELALAAGLLVVLAGFLLQKLIAYRGESERVAAKQLVGSLRTALAVRSAQAVSANGQAGLLALSRENPMDWLSDPPWNYLGEYYSPQPSALPDGHWYFDRADLTLVYLPSANKSFSAGTSKFLRFKVELLRGPKPVEPGGPNTVTGGLELGQIIDQSVALANQAGHSAPFNGEN